ncbi:MAG: hypothetical protein AB7H93_12600 [Vicinamibacterales bacterium]
MFWLDPDLPLRSAVQPALAVNGSSRNSRGTVHALELVMSMTFTSRPVRRSLRLLPLLGAACLAAVTPAAADAPERDTRTWTDGKVRVTFSVPETYGDCRPRHLADSVYTDGVPTRWRLAGRFNVGYIADGEFTIVKVIPVDQLGDLALTIEYPSHAEIRPHTSGVFEYHIEPQIEVFDEGGRKSHFIGGDLARAAGTLGPGGQDWDVFCASTTSSAAP